MKLIVQIPCFNEAQTLPQTAAGIPREIEGIDEVEILVVDDGSTDGTIEVAHAIGIDHMVQHKCNLGLASAFRTGLDACLGLGADIIVNTDGDNQYAGSDIPRLIAPILAAEADIVIGDRQTWNALDCPRGKRILQAMGSLVVRRISGTNVPDAVSGFRAISREAALQLNIVSRFSYTIESIIQAGKKHLTVASIPVTTNSDTRESRLFKSIPEFVARSLATIVRTYAMYEPLRVCLCLSVGLSILGMIPIVRFACVYLFGDGSGHIQSVVLGGVVLLMGFIMLVIGMVADLISLNRQLTERVLEELRRLRFEQDHLDRLIRAPEHNGCVKRTIRKIKVS